MYNNLRCNLLFQWFYYNLNIIVTDAIMSITYYLKPESRSYSTRWWFWMKSVFFSFIVITIIWFSQSTLWEDSCIMMVWDGGKCICMYSAKNQLKHTFALYFQNLMRCMWFYFKHSLLLLLLWKCHQNSFCSNIYMIYSVLSSSIVIYRQSN